MTAVRDYSRVLPVGKLNEYFEQIVVELGGIEPPTSTLPVLRSESLLVAARRDLSIPFQICSSSILFCNANCLEMLSVRKSFA